MSCPSITGKYIIPARRSDEDEDAKAIADEQSAGRVHPSRSSNAAPNAERSGPTSNTRQNQSSAQLQPDMLPQIPPLGILVNHLMTEEGLPSDEKVKLIQNYVCLYLECLRNEMGKIYKIVTPEDVPHPTEFPGSKESELCSHVGIGCAVLITKVKTWNNATYSSLLMEKKVLKEVLRKNSIRVPDRTAQTNEFKEFFRCFQLTVSPPNRIWNLCAHIRKRKRSCSFPTQRSSRKPGIIANPSTSR